MQHLNFSCSVNSMDGDTYDYNEMVVLAASLDDCQDLEPGDIIWAKLTGLCLIFVFCLLAFNLFLSRIEKQKRKA